MLVGREPKEITIEVPLKHGQTEVLIPAFQTYYIEGETGVYIDGKRVEPAAPKPIFFRFKLPIDENGETYVTKKSQKLGEVEFTKDLSEIEKLEAESLKKKNK